MRNDHYLVRQALMALSVFHFMKYATSFSYFLKMVILSTSLRQNANATNPTVPTIMPFRVAYFQYLSFLAMSNSSLKGLAISLRKFIFFASRTKEEETSRYVIGLVMIPSFSCLTLFRSYSLKIYNYSVLVYWLVLGISLIQLQCLNAYYKIKKESPFSSIKVNKDLSVLSQTVNLGLFTLQSISIQQKLRFFNSVLLVQLNQMCKPTLQSLIPMPKLLPTPLFYRSLPTLLQISIPNLQISVFLSQRIVLLDRNSIDSKGRTSSERLSERLSKGCRIWGFILALITVSNVVNGN